MEPQGRGPLVEPKVGGAKAEPTGWCAEVERKDQRSEAKPQESLAQTRLVVVQFDEIYKYMKISVCEKRCATEALKNDHIAPPRPRHVACGKEVPLYFYSWKQLLECG